MTFSIGFEYISKFLRHIHKQRQDNEPKMRQKRIENVYALCTVVRALAYRRVVCVCVAFAPSMRLDFVSLFFYYFLL